MCHHFAMAGSIPSCSMAARADSGERAFPHYWFFESLCIYQSFALHSKCLQCFAVPVNKWAFQTLPWKTEHRGS